MPTTQGSSCRSHAEFPHSEELQERCRDSRYLHSKERIEPAASCAYRVRRGFGLPKRLCGALLHRPIHLAEQPGPFGNLLMVPSASTPERNDAASRCRLDNELPLLGFQQLSCALQPRME